MVKAVIKSRMQEEIARKKADTEGVDHGVRTAIGCGVLIVLFFVHPFIFGLWGRFLETRFRHSITVGMTKKQVSNLWGQSGDAFYPYDDLNKHVTYGFLDWSTICYEKGNEFVVTFDIQDRVKSWIEGPWIDGC